MGLENLERENLATSATHLLLESVECTSQFGRGGGGIGVEDV